MNNSMLTSDFLSLIFAFCILHATSGFSQSADASNSQGNSISQRDQKTYRHIIEGSKADQEKYKLRAEQYQKRGDQMKKKGGGKEKMLKAKKILQLSKLYESLSETNATIANSFSGGSSDLFMTAVEELPNIEKRIAMMTGKPVDREWLTISEVQELKSKGYKSTADDPDVYPYLKKLWNPPKAGKGKARKRKTRKKTSSK
jgi:thermostable 8-oxoguanine DNA glycosylase